MNIESIRSEINQLDEEIAELLAKRVSLVIAIGNEKAKAGLPVLDQIRERDVLAAAARIGLNHEQAESVQRIYISILEESRRLQSQGADNSKQVLTLDIT